jgi:uncharacterized protein (TIGR02145 family)
MKLIYLLLLIYITGFAQQPCLGILTVKYEEKIYNTVLIGSQCWLKENLDVGKQIKDSSNQLNNGIIEKYCYNDDSANCTIYGGLYQWNEAMQYNTLEKAKGICPVGWHIPTKAEFDTLSKFVHQDGNALKTVHQGKENNIGTNTSGFSALLSGYRYTNGLFYRFKRTACFWSSTKFGIELVDNMNLDDNEKDINQNNYSFINGFSVRCLMDF